MNTSPLFLFGPLIGGVLFALGLGVSGMLEPAKIVGFLDLFGNWDPSLIFVMVGAIGVHMVFYRLIIKRPSPLFDVKFHLPTKQSLDVKLIFGSTLFGIGWALAGLCPGPGIVSLVSGQVYAIIFVATMIIGTLVAKFIERWT